MFHMNSTTQNLSVYIIYTQYLMIHTIHFTSRIMMYWNSKRTNYTVDCVTSAYICQDGRGRLLTHVTNYCEEEKKSQFHLFAVSKSDKASYSQPSRPAPAAYWCHVANRPLLSARSPSSPWANLLLPLGGSPATRSLPGSHHIFAPSCHTCC